MIGTQVLETATTMTTPVGISLAKPNVDSSPGHVAHQETGRPHLGLSPASLQTSDSDPLPNEPTQPGLPVHGPTVSSIQTIQTFLTQTIQSNLTAILPGLIQGEVRIQCAQLAQEIGTQISSIRDEVIRPTGDPDDPMLPSCEEGEIEGSRGRDKQSTRRSYNKRKGKQVRLGKESDGETEGSGSEGDEGNGSEGDEGNGSEGNEGNEGNEGIGKKCKKIQALRVSKHSCA
jgi:hypothetical protein